MNEKTYWNHNGKYQKEYDELSAFIPEKGMAETIKGELLRCASRLYYDVYNNGLCNDKTYEIEFIRHYFGFEVVISWLISANSIDGYGVKFDGTLRDKKTLEELENLMDRIILEIK